MRLTEKMLINMKMDFFASYLSLLDIAVDDFVAVLWSVHFAFIMLLL